MAKSTDFIPIVGTGKVALNDGSAGHAVVGTKEIARFGGWRVFLATRSSL